MNEGSTVRLCGIGAWDVTVCGQRLRGSGGIGDDASATAWRRTLVHFGRFQFIASIVMVALSCAALGCGTTPTATQGAPVAPTPDETTVADTEAAKTTVGDKVSAAQTRAQRAAAANAAYQQERWAECATLYAQIGDSGSRRDHNLYNAACCASRGGDIEQAFSLLDKSVANGLRQTDLIQTDKDLAPMRGDPRWAGIVTAVRAQEQAYLQTINRELYAMYKADQAARTGGTNIDWSVVSREDAERRERTAAFIDRGGLSVGDDYYHAAMIFQHGDKPEHYSLANELARKAVELDPDNKSARWLIAASEDRLRHSLGTPQIYGTQFRKGHGSSWTLDPIDETAVTDEQRAEYGVPPLADAKKRVEAMNKRDNLK